MAKRMEKNLIKIFILSVFIIISFSDNCSAYEGINFNITDGLKSNEFNGDAYFKTESGELFFCGINSYL